MGAGTIKAAKRAALIMADYDEQINEDIEPETKEEAPETAKPKKNKEEGEAKNGK
jgi:hypothetical protein